MPKHPADVGMVGKSDEELASDLRQLWQEKVRCQKELERRGYEVSCCSYTDGSTTVEIDRVTKSVL